MGLRQEQSLFVNDVQKLLTFITDKGYEITFGEVLRTPEQQEIYLKTGRSKTSNSMHLKKLAIDLNIFKDGNLVEDNKELKQFGYYWQSLNELNRWGGSWRGLVESGASSFVDSPHYERNI